MDKNNIKQIRFCALGAICISSLAFPIVALAENDRDFGTGAHGVNRVIRTPQGYRAFSGRYSLEFSSPRNEQGNFETEQSRRDANDGTIEQSRLDPDLVVENRPSVYVGGNFVPATAPGGANRSEVDVGIQLEPVTKYRTRPGWSVFFYVAEGIYLDRDGERFPERGTVRLELNPRVFNATTGGAGGIPWRPAQGAEFSKIEGTMTLEATPDGRARVSCTSLPTPHAMWVTLRRPSPLPPTIPPAWRVDENNQLAPRRVADPSSYQNTSALVVFSPSQYSQGTIKRVTAMTRPNSPQESRVRTGLNDELDGSWLRARWFEAQVTPTGETSRTWGQNDMDPNETGYDSPAGNGDRAYDKRYRTRRTQEHDAVSAPTGRSRTIVEFDEITGPNNTRITNETLRAQVGHASRYADETVTINLGMIARPVGEAVK